MALHLCGHALSFAGLSQQKEPQSPTEHTKSLPKALASLQVELPNPHATCTKPVKAGNNLCTSGGCLESRGLATNRVIYLRCPRRGSQSTAHTVSAYQIGRTPKRRPTASIFTSLRCGRVRREPRDAPGPAPWEKPKPFRIVFLQIAFMRSVCRILVGPLARAGKADPFPRGQECFEALQSCLQSTSVLLKVSLKDGWTAAQLPGPLGLLAEHPKDGHPQGLRGLFFLPELVSCFKFMTQGRPRAGRREVLPCRAFRLGVRAQQKQAHWLCTQQLTA